MPKERGLFSRTVRVVREEARNPGAAAAGGTGNGGGNYCSSRAVSKPRSNNYAFKQFEALENYYNFSKKLFIHCRFKVQTLIPRLNFLIYTPSGHIILKNSILMRGIVLGGSTGISLILCIYFPELYLKLYYYNFPTHFTLKDLFSYLIFVLPNSVFGIPSNPLNSTIHAYFHDLSTLDKSLKLLNPAKSPLIEYNNFKIRSNFDSLLLLKNFYITSSFSDVNDYLYFNKINELSYSSISSLVAASKTFIDSFEIIFINSLNSQEGLIELNTILKEVNLLELSLGELTPYVRKHPLLTLIQNIDNPDVINNILSEHNNRLAFLLEKNYSYYISLIDKLENLETMDEESKLLLNSIKRIIVLAKKKVNTVLESMEDIDDAF